MSPQPLQKPAAEQPHPPRQVRMTLASITRGKQPGPVRLVLYGVDGVGKTTFAAHAPNPVFIGAEDGTSELDVARFPAPESWLDVLDAIRALTLDAGGFKTLAVDTVDWAEPLLWKHFCKVNSIADKDEFRGGFNRWEDAVLDHWRIFLAALEKLQSAQRMNVILLGHVERKAFKNPEGPDYDRYILKLHQKSAALIREWAKGVYIAKYEAFGDRDEKTKRVRGVSTGERLLYTEWSAAFDAKDRYGLPPSIKLDWTEFERARVAADPAVARVEIERDAKALGGEFEKFALAYLGQHGEDAMRLKILRQKLQTKLAEKAALEASPVAPATETGANDEQVK